MRTYDVYGTSAVTMDELRALLETVLGQPFTEHDSDYLGGVYFQSGEPLAESFRIVSNHGAVDPEDLPEPDFLDLHVILEVNDSPRGAALRQDLPAAVPGMRLLRTTET